jgi:hypothetical protein|tara:strand:+ start:94 stop:300 length:207 start_codon:yes stop_codon:yes gene_type:complete
MKKLKHSHENWCWCGGASGGLFWGLLVLALGLWFLAKDLGWVSLNVSIWPVILIILGVWMLLKRNKCS